MGPSQSVHMSDLSYVTVGLPFEGLRVIRDALRAGSTRYMREANALPLGSQDRRELFQGSLMCDIAIEQIDEVLDRAVMEDA